MLVLLYKTFPTYLGVLLYRPMKEYPNNILLVYAVPLLRKGGEAFHQSLRILCYYLLVRLIGVKFIPLHHAWSATTLPCFSRFKIFGPPAFRADERRASPVPLQFGGFLNFSNFCFAAHGVLNDLQVLLLRCAPSHVRKP